MITPTPSSAFIEPAGGPRGIYRVFTLVETSTFAGSMPAYPLIADAFRRSLPRYTITDPAYEQWGEWIGPGPRVVRFQTSSVSAYQTHATWVAFWPDTDFTRERFEWLEQHLVQVLSQNLKAITGSSDWSPVIEAPYEPAVNGPVDFWKSGQATATRTRDVSGGTLTGAHENPLGPDHLVPSTGLNLGNVGRWVLVGGVLTGLVWVLSKETDPYQERLPYRR